MYILDSASSFASLPDQFASKLDAAAGSGLVLVAA
jgi:hypothetical protein